MFFFIKYKISKYEYNTKVCCMHRQRSSVICKTETKLKKNVMHSRGKK